MKTFEPQLVLAREPDGEFTLNAVTIAPNSCYSAGRAELGPPPNVRLLPEVLPVLLHLRARTGPCLMVLTPARHQIHDLKLGAAHGKTSVAAFVMLNGAVVGSAFIKVDEPGTCVNEGAKPVSTADWYAWINRMPPGPASFHVRGTVQVPTPGFAARLKAAVPQGINAAELILDLVVEKLPGQWPQVVTSLQVAIDEAPLGVPYKGVLIRVPGSDAVHVEVEEVF
jgi:hypothetical protein